VFVKAGEAVGVGLVAIGIEQANPPKINAPRRIKQTLAIRWLGFVDIN
jgi:hypothetical protein